MKHSIPLLLVILSCFSAQAQVELDHFVITPLGGHSFDSTFSVSYTMGQVEVQTLVSNNGTLILTQGFQQPEMLGVGVDDELEILVNYQIYPNPTPGIVHVKLTTNRLVDLQLEMVNLLGQPIGIPAQHQKVTGDWETSFDLEGAASGYYFLMLRNEQGEIAGAWKVHKLDQ